ncbi:MAG: hypothetical protein COA79_07285 [Planctomycetota bacterium]|nr:MAG: hypothetical protein COA79_07285 [Planctomycetota bacterium]
MKSSRHPHPHIDPRQPENKSKPGTNPPVFAWKSDSNKDVFSLIVSRDRKFADIVFEIKNLKDSLYLPEKVFEIGQYYWKWESESSKGETFSFRITKKSVKLEVPLAKVWLDRFDSGHPRIYVDSPKLEVLKTFYRNELPSELEDLTGKAEDILLDSHEIEEPPFLADPRKDYEKFFSVWYDVLTKSRKFVREAETLAMAWMFTGEKKYGRAACQRMVSISKWDPFGSSHIDHNDEAHMSFLWDGVKVCDWIWDVFTKDERKLVIDQFRKRGEITFDHMHSRGSYGVTRFDSHAGREIVFLGLLAIVFHEEIPDARKWLDWLRPVLCGIWPIWAKDDGAWAEGPSYSQAYITIMTMFATALKEGADIDLYKRPFWSGQCKWRQWCIPFYSEWQGFGDHSEVWGSTCSSEANLLESIEHQLGTNTCAKHISEFRKRIEKLGTPEERVSRNKSSLAFLFPMKKEKIKIKKQTKMLEVFPGAGWASLRSNLDSAKDDVALIFRSSPFGSISHSHANNNDFILHVAGKAMVMPSGYYDGYGSAHHTHWIWHTKSHNCLTYSDSSQLMRSHDSRGEILNQYEDKNLVYFCGNADDSYLQVERCRRHVLFLKNTSTIIMVDESINADKVIAGLQWNIHSRDQFDLDEENRTFLLEREGSLVKGYFMYGKSSYFTKTEGWLPTMILKRKDEQWVNQYHLRFSTADMIPQVNLGVILCPEYEGLKAPVVQRELIDSAEIAHIGDDLVVINQNKREFRKDDSSDKGVLSIDGKTTKALIALKISDVTYTIDDEGVQQLGDIKT